MSLDIVSRIDQIFDNIESFNRDVYRSIRKNKPELNLPSEGQIAKEFGSFGVFCSIIKKENRNKKPVSLDEEAIVDKVKELFFNGNIKNRDDYRRARKNNPTLDLPSCDKISKIIGSFSNLKSLVEKNKYSVLVSFPERKVVEEVVEAEVKVVEEAVEVEVKEAVEEAVEAEVKEELTYIHCATESHTDIKMDCRDEHKNSYEIEELEEEEIEEEIDEDEDTDEFLSAEQINNLRDLVKTKKLELFGGKRQPYYWQPQSRKGRWT